MVFPPPGVLDEPGSWPEGLPDVEEPSEAELLGVWPDPFAGAPEGEDAWLGDLSVPELDVLAARWAAGLGPDAVGAGFVRDLPGEGAAGFAAGGPLDAMVPGVVLAGFAGGAFDRDRFAGLSDDELVGVLGAARRLESWQAAMEFTAVAELDKRRQAAASRPESSRVHDQVGAEVAAALVLAPRPAEGLVDLARGLARLPDVLAGLAVGVIDRDRAGVFVAELAGLDDRAAAGVARELLGAAGQMTAGRLRSVLRSMVLALNPGAAKDRAERGRRQARVEAWPEGSGNHGLAGRELPPADVLAADARITAIARSLRDGGAAGGMDELRAAVFCALLTGRDPRALLPRPGGGDAGPLAGTIHLTMPVSAWLGECEAPGEAAGFGPLDAGTCRDLAGRLAADPGTPWCLTLTGPGGRAVAHGCARAGPGGHGPQAWPASLKLHWLERDRCGHARQVASYRPGRALRHLTGIRDRTCRFPGCDRPAVRCDADHTVPYDHGGPTCECNLAALCRQHHQTKQAQGWHITQPQPGTLVWVAPHGRTYIVEPDSYPV